MEDSDSPLPLAVAMGRPVTASLGPVGPLLRQLHSPLLPEGDIQSLRDDLDRLCISLMNHSVVEEPSYRAKSWMSEIRELCYDAKNFMDDAPFLLKQDDDAQLTEEDELTEEEIGVLGFKALEIKNRVTDASKRSESYKIAPQNINKAKFLSRRRGLPVLHPELIGRGRLMDDLATMVRSDGEEKRQLKAVVSLVGLEGVGKTTLAKSLYHKTGGEFRCRAFVRVSPNPDMRRLLASIFTQIQSPGSPKPACCLDAQHLIKNIRHYLQEKRYLIVIDDLWSISVWDIIRRAFPDDCPGSRIMTITQSEDVASACCSYKSKNIFKMEPLEGDQSERLFLGIVFGSEDNSPEAFRSVSAEISEKCGQLPLLIVTVASLLPVPSEIDLQQLKDIRDSLPPILKRNLSSEGIKEVLNLMYNDLAPELKTCLLYFAMYPEGYTVDKNDLVKQWVVEGFTGEGQNKEEIALGYFDELLSRGMIQAVDINDSEVVSCTLHHMVHDLIVKESMEENFIIGVDYFQSAVWLPHKVRRLSVQFGGAKSARLPAGITLSEVRSLAFFGFYECADFIEKCKLLRVLTLHVWADDCVHQSKERLGISPFEDKNVITYDLSGISKLLPLRYLKVACNIAVKLPDEIQALKYMETLEVDATVVAIPSGIGRLGSLSSLKIAVRVLSQGDICILKELRALSALSLHVWAEPVEMIFFDKGEFLVVKYFKFRCSVPWLKFEAGSMPDLKNLNLCFNAHEADQQGIVPIGIEHLSGLEEITANIWGADTDVSSTFRTAVSNHPSNPRINVQLVDNIFHGEDEKKEAVDSSMSTLHQSKRNFTLLGSSSHVHVQGAEKKPKLEIETDSAEVKPETFAYDPEDTIHMMSNMKIESDIIIDKTEKNFDGLEDMDIEDWMPSSPTNKQAASATVNPLGILTDQQLRTRSISPPTGHRIIKERIAQLFVAMDLATFMDCAQILSNINACHDFFSWTTSGIKTALRNRKAAQLPGEEEIEKLDTKLGQLKNDLWKLKTTMPKMLDLIDRAEWQSHRKEVADLLPDIKDAVYDAEDLLDEFDYYALKLKVEWSKTSGQDHLRDAFLEFFDRVGSNDYIRTVNEIQVKLDHVHRQSTSMSWHQALQKFDKSFRPETISFLREPKIFGRDKDLKQLVETLGVRGARKRARTESKAKMSELDVLPIVGMGGVGKTTIAQQICKDAKVKDHFDCIIWICVSDDFDTKRLSKEIVEHMGENISSNNLNVVMKKLEDCVKSKRFLLVLDDMWDDVLEQGHAEWNQFCEPLKNGAKGSRILVTTRSREVAKIVGQNPYELKGLQDYVFWDFFKICAFDSRSSCNNQESLECIGKNIVIKLKGSPLAARTIGRLLKMDLSTSHWENILQSELWKLEQTKTDILPALRLSYMYLEQKLKRCFSICAMYPKDYKFEKDFLADIWVAQGYVADPQEASLCFYALANRSFFQKASPHSDKYVIHDLMHDTVQLVSKDECFTIKYESDIDKVPSNVRHLSIFANGNIKCSKLKGICHKKKLRSLVCDESYTRARDFAPLVDCWFKELLKIRVLRFKVCNVKQLPESMGNSKHLRYLCLLGSSKFGALPSSVSRLHQLKIVERVNSEFESIPPGFSDAISLQKIKSKSFTYNKDRSDKLCLEWSGGELSQEMTENQMEHIPYRNLQHLELYQFGGESCPSWFRPNLLPMLRSLELLLCHRFKSVPFFGPLEGSLDNAAQGFSSLTWIKIRQCISLTYIPLHVWSSNLPSLEDLYIYQCNSLTSIGVCGPSSSSSGGSGVKGFSSLATIRILQCKKLLSLDELLTPDYLPVVKTISLVCCDELISLSVHRLDGLQDLEISLCPKLNPERVMTFPSSLKKLRLYSCVAIESININNSESRTSSQLEDLNISSCPVLKSIGGATATNNLKRVSIMACPELSHGTWA